MNRGVPPRRRNGLSVFVGLVLLVGLLVGAAQIVRQTVTDQASTPPPPATQTAAAIATTVISVCATVEAAPTTTASTPGIAALGQAIGAAWSRVIIKGLCDTARKEGPYAFATAVGALRRGVLAADTALARPAPGVPTAPPRPISHPTSTAPSP